MEVNSFIFSAPKCEYNENTFKELIWIPVYDKTINIPKRQASQLCTRMSSYKNLNSQPDNDPLQDISNSQYDQDVDELIDKTRSPVKIMKNYQSSFNSCATQKNTISTLYKSVAKIASHQSRSESVKTSSIKAAGSKFNSINRKILYKIPCIHINNKAHYTLIYFHANGEDLFTCYDFLWHLGDQLHANVITMEYPGYGIYKGEPSEKRILQDSEALYLHLTQIWKIKQSQIILCGRSLGSGQVISIYSSPGCHLASIYKPSLLILISPFLSIRQVVEYKFGKFLSSFIKERFMNQEKIKNISCPLFVLHGHNDQIIPLRHSYQLINLSPTSSVLISPQNMTHAQFHFKIDLVQPLLKFMKQNLL